LYYNVVNQGLARLPQMMPSVGFANAKLLKDKGDCLHFDTESAIILGQRYASKYAELIGLLTKKELIKYIRLSKFKNALKKHGSHAYETISIKTWAVGITAAVIAVYVYKQLYSNKSPTTEKRE